MVERIPEPLLARLSEFVATKMGLNFPPERWGDLEKNIRPVTVELGFRDVANGVEWLLSSQLSRSQTEVLASHLTVGETYFFREKQAFEFLEKRVVPGWMDRRGADKRVRIWSAGCCSGEEPYSLAIFLSKVIPDWQKWNITILATDINPRFLGKASRGIYNEWSFRGTPSWVKDCCFKTVNRDRYEILPQFKKLVTFGHLNLAEDVYPSLLNNTNAMDLIFCRNVLMYFTEEQARKVVKKFHSTLVNGGWLMVSATETSTVLYESYALEHFEGFTFYRKTAEQTASTKAQPIFRKEVISSPPSPSAIFSLPVSTVELPSPPQSPQPPEATACQKALELYEAGRYQEVTENLLDPNGEIIFEEERALLLARAFANQGQLAESLAWCDKAIAAKKMNAESHYLRAIILQEQGRLEESAAALERALYLDPEFILVYFALGNLALRREDAEKSAKHFRNALSLLERVAPEAILPGSEGLTSARLSEIIRATMREEKSS